MFFVLCRDKISKTTKFITRSDVSDNLKQSIELLEQCSIKFIEEEHGIKRASNPFKSLTGSEPLDLNTIEDGFYLVKPLNNPFRIDVYNKKTLVKSGYLYNTAEIENKLVKYFYIIEADNALDFTVCSKCNETVHEDRIFTTQLYLAAKDTNYTKLLNEMVISDLFQRKKSELNNDNVSEPVSEPVSSCPIVGGNSGIIGGSSNYSSRNCIIVGGSSGTLTNSPVRPSIIGNDYNYVKLVDSVELESTNEEKEPLLKTNEESESDTESYISEESETDTSYDESDSDSDWE